MNSLASAVFLLLLGACVADAAVFRAAKNIVRQKNNTAGDVATKAAAALTTFEGFYNAHSAGRGVWKWNNALVAYDRHFGAWAGGAVKLAEVGVQSGGSILMWQAVLGASCHVYGIDINKACTQFANPTTTITIGDQEDVNMWTTFFAQTTPNLDILIDDGGHSPNQMLVTLQQVFPKTNPGGFVAIEDIHGTHYVGSFFTPAATYLGQQHAQQGLVHSVHVYPFLLVVKKAGAGVLPATELALTAAATVDSFEALWKALPANTGKAVAVANPAWGSFLAEPALKEIFTQFGSLHASNMQANPPGCATTAAPVCTTSVVNSQGQNSISGVHVYADRLLVEVAATPPLIAAVRKGTEWLAYGF